jgi:RecA/RadA recombinase
MTTESFKQFIVEAADRETDIDRIITVIQKRMPTMLNSKIYRFGGKDGIEQLSAGAKGYLYFFGTGKAFRVRVRKNHIDGFDIWKQYTINGRPDFTIDTQNTDVATVAKELKAIASIIKTPKAGEIKIAAVAESVSVGFDEVLYEAKSVSPEQFLDLAKKTLDDADLNSVTWDQIVRTAKDNNVAVPNKKYLDGQKTGRGRWTLIPGAGMPEGGDSKPEASAGPKKADPIMYIKVTAQDPVTKKFLPTADNKQAQELYKQIQSSISADREPSKEELRDVDTLYGHLFKLVTMACTNKLRALLIYGGPGTGKTFTIMQAVKKAGLQAGEDYVKLAGKVSAVELYKTLFMFRKGGLVLLDDCDSVWKDKDSANILKAALDTSPVREISSATAMTKNVSKLKGPEREEYNDQVDKFLAGGDVEEDDEDGEEDGEEGGSKKSKKKEKLKFPSTFEFKGRVVFISNLKKEEFDSAIMSRSAKIDMSLTAEETLRRMRSVLPHLGGDDVPLEKKEELIQVLLDLNKKKVLDQVTMREFIKGLDIVRSGDPDWKELIQYS